MRNYVSSEWAAGDKSASIQLTTRDTIELDVVSGGIITISGITAEDGEHVPLTAGAHHVHVKTKFEGFSSLEIQSTKTFGYRFIGRAGQIGEPMDDRAAPEPKAPTNILQQMRSIIKTELAATRENFLVNDTDLPGYEIDDDDDQFEEEMLQAKITAVNEQKAKLAGDPPAAPETAAPPAKEPKETTNE